MWMSTLPAYKDLGRSIHPSVLALVNSSDGYCLAQSLAFLLVWPSMEIENRLISPQKPDDSSLGTKDHPS